jgi:hypothetical protein
LLLSVIAGVFCHLILEREKIVRNAGIWGFPLNGKNYSFYPHTIDVAAGMNRVNRQQ